MNSIREQFWNGTLGLNSTESKAAWTMYKHGFSWAGDNIFKSVKAGKRALRKLEKLGIAKVKDIEAILQGWQPEFILTDEGRAWLTEMQLRPAINS